MEEDANGNPYTNDLGSFEVSRLFEESFYNASSCFLMAPNELPSVRDDPKYVCPDAQRAFTFYSNCALLVPQKLSH